MKSFPVTRFSYLFVIVLVAFFVGGGTVNAAAAVSCGSWNVVSSPNAGQGDDILSGAAAVPGTQDFWAVGRYDGSDGFYHTLTERWNGSSWSVVKSPNVHNMNNVLNAVAVISATDVWAVGLSGSGDGIEGVTLIEHWNGTNWSIVKSPSPSQDLYFNAVAGDSATDAWAAGSYEANNGHFRTFIEHWDGTSWSIVKSPSPDCCYNSLQSVTALSATNAWAVGFHGPFTLVEHWNGSSWSVVKSPNAVTGQDENNYLYAVAPVSGSASDIWAVGTYYGTNNPHGYQTLTEHWNGSKWSIVKSPAPGGNGSNPELYAVAPVSTNDVWAVGYSIAGSSAYLTLVEHWNGSAWSVVPSPSPGGLNAGDESVLYGVAALSANNVQAVGYDRTDYFNPTATLAESYC
jgi:hypothetical protein